MTFTSFACTKFSVGMCFNATKDIIGKKESITHYFPLWMKKTMIFLIFVHVAKKDRIKNILKKNRLTIA